MTPPTRHGWHVLTNICLESQKSGDVGASVAAPAEFQIHLELLSEKNGRFHGDMSKNPKTVTHAAVHW